MDIYIEVYTHLKSPNFFPVYDVADPISEHHGSSSQELVY